MGKEGAGKVQALRFGRGDGKRRLRGPGSAAEHLWTLPRRRQSPARGRRGRRCLCGEEPLLEGRLRRERWAQWGWERGGRRSGRLEWPPAPQWGGSRQPETGAQPPHAPPHPRAPQQLPPPPFPGPLDPGRSLSNRLELPLPLYLALAFNKKSCCNWTPGGWSGGNCWLPAVGRAAVYLLGAGGRKGERAPGRPAGSSAAAAAAFQNPAQAETFGRVLLPSRTSLSSLLAQARRALFAPCLPSRRAPDVPSGFSSWGLGEIPLFSFCSHCHAGE